MKTILVDHAGRPLTAWRGCGELESGQIFLLNDASQASFDGRYFGPTSRRDIIGKLVTLWVFLTHFAVCSIGFEPRARRVLIIIAIEGGPFRKRSGDAKLYNLATTGPPWPPCKLPNATVR